MRMYDIILKKREGGKLSPEEIAWFVAAYTEGDIPDYQVSALMMAIFFRGMEREETFALVEAMLNSGDRIDLSAVQGIKVDKHSTGGVGDKTSLVLGPLVAAAGAPVAKMTGRGLGHTGGTMDKLESFTGFQTEPAIDEFIHWVNVHGIALSGQSANLVPADKKLYALRDVTATVENLSLIAGSIMSKKLASGADAIILDVKCGDGAFMKTRESAFALALEMCAIGKAFGRETRALISAMDQPLGYTVGNALEVREAIATLRGEGPEDLRTLCLELGARMLRAAGKAPGIIEARLQLETLIEDGSALAKMQEWVAAQGGDASQVTNPDLLPHAGFVHEVHAEHEGYVSALKAESVGVASMLLGAGRISKGAEIDLAAGVVLHKKVGDKVQRGEVLAELHCSDASLIAAAEARLRPAYAFSETPPPAAELILGEID